MRIVTLAMLISATTWAAPKSEANKEAKKKAFDQLQDILKGEPSAKEVQQATLHYYKLEPERLNQMARATNLKGLLPEIESGIDNNIGHNFSNTKDGLYPRLPSLPDNPNPNSYKERVDGATDQTTWHIKGVWMLDRILFNSEELDVKSLASIEENLVREVTTLYFSRRRLLANLLLTPPKDDEERYFEMVRLDELTATLDALTGGMFAQRAWKHDEEAAPPAAATVPTPAPDFTK